jgi:phage terminase large subunit-like protein
MAARRKSEGNDVIQFIESCCRVTKGADAGSLIELRPWQKALMRDLFSLRDDGLRQYRRGLIGMPRKNGKSTLASGITLFGLIADGEPGAEVYCVAASRQQARIVFDTCRAMVEQDPVLSQIVKVYRSHLEVPSTGSVMRVLSSDAGLQEGLSPHMVVLDELHAHYDDSMWNVMTLGSGARRNPLILAITTAGVRTDRHGYDTIAYRLYQYGKQLQSGEKIDDSFFFRWWEAPENADWKSVDAVKIANPAFDDYLMSEDFEVSRRTTTEVEYRIKRLNQWVQSHNQWLPDGAFKDCQDLTLELPPPETEIIVGFDGSYSRDATAIVCSTLDGHIWVEGLWERPQHDDEWRVPIDQVMDAIRNACQKWRVMEIVSDPYRYEHQLQTLEDEGFPVLRFPTNSAQRMVPACGAFYDAITTQQIKHNGQHALSRHIDNCIVKVDRAGPRITKESRQSERKIDAAVAAVIAYSRVVYHRQRKPQIVPSITNW